MRDKHHWEERYKNDDMPWERGKHHPEVERLFLNYIPVGWSVLDIGCGLGNDAEWLVKSGYKLTAIDISEEAIARAKASKSKEIQFLVLDFLNEGQNLPAFDVVLDCAAFHLIQDESIRNAFVKKVAEHCKYYWINISCSKDEAELLSEHLQVKAPPYLSAKKIIDSVEPAFEVIEMHRCDFSIDRGAQKQGRATFHAWGSIFKKR